MKIQTSVSLTQEATRLADKLKEKYGVSRNAIIEMAIREKATKENVDGTPQGGSTNGAAK